MLSQKAYQNGTFRICWSVNFHRQNPLCHSTNSIITMNNYSTLCPQKKLMAITLSILNGFSKFGHCWKEKYYLTEMSHQTVTKLLHKMLMYSKLHLPAYIQPLTLNLVHTSCNKNNKNECHHPLWHVSETTVSQQKLLRCVL